MLRPATLHASKPLTAVLHPLLAATVGAAIALALVDLTPAFGKGEPKTANCDRFKKNSPDWRRCTGSVRDDLSDDQIYYAGYWLARSGQYVEAIEFLKRAKVPDARILTYIGFATRKLGDVDAAMGYYERALALDPASAVTRSYFGEALLERGDRAGAEAQLRMIETSCGTLCREYADLAVALVR
jgi:tetratricopeptide (TPR) repeat protein